MKGWCGGGVCYFEDYIPYYHNLPRVLWGSFFIQSSRLCLMESCNLFECYRTWSNDLIIKGPSLKIFRRPKPDKLWQMISNILNVMQFQPPPITITKHKRFLKLKFTQKTIFQSIQSCKMDSLQGDL